MAGLMIPLCRAGRGRSGSHGVCVCSGSVVFHRGKLNFHMYTVDSGSWPRSWIQEVVLREQAGRLLLPNLSHDAAL